MLKLAILDDYQDVATTYADWSGLKDRVEITVFRDTIHDLDALVSRLAPFEIIATMRERTPFPRALFDRLPRLRLLTTTGGHNHAFDLVAAAEHGVAYCGSISRPDTTAELTWGLIIGLMRHICAENANMHRGGWQSTVGDGLRGKVLGVLGLAAIGSQVAAVGKAFGMDVAAWSTNLTEAACRDAGVRLVDKRTLFAASDIVTIHIRLSERTVRIVGAGEIALMQPHSYLINTSRGPLIDEPALVAALQARKIRGAALDVFETEPLPVDHPLRQLSNVLLMPHVGYVTDEMYREMWPQTVENITNFLEGRPMRSLAP